MKRLLILFAILALAFIAAPAFATEAIGPPGITAAPIDFDAVLFPVAVQVPKEFSAVAVDALALSTSTAIDVAPAICRPVIGLALAAEKNACNKYMVCSVQSDNRPSLGSVA